MTAALSRIDRRRMKRLTSENEAVVEADRRFFKRFPDRTYRLRRMSRAEVAQFSLMHGGPIVTEPGSVPFVLLKQLAPGVRLRVLTPGRADEDGSDLSDRAGSALWQIYCARHPIVAEREAAMRDALYGPGGPLAAESGR